MLISKVRIQNFRCFSDTTVDFRPGINIIIGENNAGKTALLKSLALVFQRGAARLGRYGFHQNTDAFDSPPSITITVTLQSSASDSPNDKATVYAWLTKLESPWQATLTYRFFLPEEDLHIFKQRCPAGSSAVQFWDTVEELLPRYVTRIYGGEPANKNKADPETLSSFEYQFLDATRDVEERMVSGRSSVLRTVVSHAFDADLLPVSAEDRLNVLSDRRQKFRTKADSLMEEMKQRLNVGHFLQMAELTGASAGGQPTIQGKLEESDLLSTLRLMVSAGSSDKGLPVTHNGLGYNNLLYMSLVLSHLEQEASSAAYGSNAKCFPMLVIEEPEAHLHPALQYRVVEYIKKRMQSSSGNSHASRQVFITTHSTHITAAGGLDTIICMTAPEHHNGVRISYPGQAFDQSDEGQKSKKYVERYLDATRSEMLFAKAVLFVEGVSEQLLVPVLAESLGSSLVKQLVSVVAVGGSTFKHFLPLFGSGPNESRHQYALTNRRVACLVDGDPSSRSKTEVNSKWRSCFPYQIDYTPDFEYRPTSSVALNLIESTKDSKNIKIFVGSKTLEYDLAYTAISPVLVTSACKHEKYLKEYAADPTKSISKLNSELDLVENAALTMNEEKKGAPPNARFATYYVNCIGGNKGEHALELAQSLRENMLQSTNATNVEIPKYIQQAVEWVCGKEMSVEHAPTSATAPQAA